MSDLMTGSFQNMDFETQLPANHDYYNPDPVVMANFPWKFNGGYVLNDGQILLSAVEQYVFYDGVLSLYAALGATNSYAQISQTGSIPSSANSIQISYKNTPPKVYLDGTEVTLYKTSPGILAGDIRAWSGATAELKIRSYTVETEPFGLNYESSDIDNIGFSTAVIPEPSTIGLVGCATLGLWLKRKKTDSTRD